MSIFSADTLGFAVAKAKLEMEIQLVKNGPYPT